MNKTGYTLILGFLGFVILNGCKDVKDMELENEKLTLNISGLEDLGSDYAYEGWLIVDGNPITAGVFNVNGNGELSKKSFDIEEDQLEKATAYILTVEPSPDSDPKPSHTHILAGIFSGQSATLETKHSAALATDFLTATGEYLLATPTDDQNDNEESGVWWLKPPTATDTLPSAGLSLPSLPTGWKYEGWVVIDKTPVTTGTFTSVSGADEAAPHSETTGAPPFPGEDFLLNAPSGLTFPTSLRGHKVVISVEPDPDNSPAPFLLKPLLATVPADAATLPTVHSMINNAQNTNPTGTATRP